MGLAAEPLPKFVGLRDGEVAFSSDWHAAPLLCGGFSDAQVLADGFPPLGGFAFSTLPCPGYDGICLTFFATVRFWISVPCTC